MQHAEATIGPDHALRLEKRVSVLVAEDDPDLRSLVVAELGRVGYEVTGVGSGYEFADYIATAEIKHRRPDVIISDVRMPGFDGLALLASIRGARWSTPVILITAFGDDDVVDLAMKHQAVTVLDKPFDIRELTKLVDAVIGVPFGLHVRPPDEELL